MMYFLLPAAPSSPLDKNTDVVFLLDGSEGVKAQIFEQQKIFVESLVNQFFILPNGPQASIITYGGDPVTTADFGDPSLVSKLRRSSLVGTARRMDKALQHAAFVLDRQTRKGPKTVILLTAGKDNADAKPLIEAKKALDELSAQVYVVAIGQDPDSQALTPVVDRSRDIFIIPRTSDLSSRARPIASSSKHSAHNFLKILGLFI